MQKFKVAFARFPGSGSERMETVGWMVRAIRQMDKDPRIDEVVSLVYSDTPVTASRNRAVKEAKAAGCDYLLMVDSDMRPDCVPGAPPFWDTAWEFLMKRRTQEQVLRDRIADGYDVLDPPAPATVAAPYCGPSPHQCVYVFHWSSPASGKPEPPFALEMIPRESAAVRAGIEEVAALPTGLILYDLRVFDVLPAPWFRYEWGDPEESEKATTEDVYPTRNASLLGLPQFCAWDCWAAHVKTEHVGRPVLVTRDMVHRSLVEAVERGVDRGDRLVILPEPERARPAAEAPPRTFRLPNGKVLDLAPPVGHPCAGIDQVPPDVD